MKIRIVLMTENNEPLPEGFTKEDMERTTKIAWNYILSQMTRGIEDNGYVESVELVEE